MALDLRKALVGLVARSKNPVARPRSPHHLERRVAAASAHPQDRPVDRAAGRGVDLADAPLDPAGSVRTGSAIVNDVVYQDGRVVARPTSLAETYAVLQKHPEAIAWIGLYRPSPGELQSLAGEFGLHELAVEDAITAHQRPKLEHFGDSAFLVLKAADYDDATEKVVFGELHIFVGSNFVITVRHAESPDLSVVRSRMESDPRLLALGGEAVIYAALDAVVDGYAPVIAGLENDIDEIEREVFDGEPTVSRRIYELSSEVIDFQLATRPLPQILDGISKHFDVADIDPELGAYLRDVADHVTVVGERLEECRRLLRDILTVNATLVAQRQNDEMQRVGVSSNRQAEEARKISGWAAILFAPSLIGSIYGMNFQNMPELDWHYGYPFALGLMAISSGVLYVVFRKNDWL